MAEPQAAAAQAGYFDVLRRNPSYRTLWLGEVVSLFGDWFNLIASASLVSNLTHSGFAVGGLFVVRMLAPFLVSPLAGVVADRVNRKHLLIASDLIRAVVVLGFLLVREPRHVWLLYALSAVQLGVSGFFFPARNAILPEIVRRGELGAANALSSSTWSVMLALGSAIGGLVAGGWGIYPAFVVDSVSFLLSALFLSRIVYKSPEVDGGPVRASTLFTQYIEGLHYLKLQPNILAVALHKPVFALVSNGIFQVVQVVIAERIFPIGEGGGISLGLMYTAAGIGTGLGPILARRFTGDQPRRLSSVLTLAYLIGVAGSLLIAPLAGFILVLVGTFIRAFGSGINWVFSTQLLLQGVPGRVRGRVFSTEFALLTLANAVSTAVAGWVLDQGGLSLSQMIYAMAILTLLPAGLWWLWNTNHQQVEERVEVEE